MTRRRDAPEETWGDGEDAAARFTTLVLDEAGRRAEQPDPAADIAVPALPGAGWRTVLDHGGRATLALLTLVTFLEAVEGQILAVLGPDIQRDLGLSDAGLGAIASIAAGVFVVAALPVGVLADRRARVPVAAAGAIVAGVFAVVTAGATQAWQAAVARLGAGAGKATTLPVHNGLLADRYPIAGRSRVFAVHNLASPLAAVSGPALVGAVAAVGGWRTAALVVAVPTIAVGIATLFLSEPERGAQERDVLLAGASGPTKEELAALEPDPPVSMTAAFTRLRRIRTLSWLLVGVGVLGFALVAVGPFLNVLLEDEYGLGAFRRGLAVSVTEIGALAGVVVGGTLGDRLFRRDPAIAVLALGGGTALYGVVFAVALYLPGGLGVVLAGVAVANFVLYAATVPIYTFVAAVVPPKLRSFGFALLGLYIFLLGGFLGGVLTGLLSDANGPRLALALVTVPSCLAAGGLAALGARHVRGDVALVVAETIEERAEQVRRLAGDELPLLQVRNLDVSYGPVQVLFGVDLDVGRGEIVALLGTNGAGKSTVLRAVSGLLVPDGGTIRFDGRTITYADPVARVDLGIGQVAGGRGVFPTLSVLDNLLAATHRFAWDAELVRRRVGHAVERFPVLADRLDQQAGSLSGGEQQMLAIARALVLEPRLLLVDELSLGLAPVVVAELLATVERLREEGTTVVLVEQSVNVALAVADRAVFLEKGRVRFAGPAADLAGRDDLLRAVLLGTGP